METLKAEFTHQFQQKKIFPIQVPHGELDNFLLWLSPLKVFVIIRSDWKRKYAPGDLITLSISPCDKFRKIIM